MANPTITLPEGFDPRGAKSGDVFECVARIQMGDGSKCTVVALDGVPYKDGAEPKQDDAPAEPGFLDAVNNGETYPQ